VAGQLDTRIQVTGPDPSCATAEALDPLDDRSGQPPSDRGGQADGQRKTQDRPTDGPVAQRFSAVPSIEAARLQIRIERCVDGDDAVDHFLELIAQLRNRVAITSGDRRHDDGLKVVIVLLGEVRDLLRQPLVGVGFGNRFEVLDRFPGRCHDLRVVTEMTRPELDQRMGLVDVLLAHLRRGHVTGVFCVVEPRHLSLGLGGLVKRHQLDRERDPEQDEHGPEGRENAASSRASQ